MCLEVHRQNEELPDHKACDLPQELRWREFMSEEANENVIKILKTVNILSYPSIQSLGLSNLAIQTVWKEASIEDYEMLINGIMEMDHINYEESERQKGLDPKRLEFE